ncbi:PREDICTED: MORC family CW-type zinc finger protein 1 [Chrysochloris asiatica]|uniref:MORC family CW-type zinc finger protein 1 n=1 Tax=Chrysochloris asiatica TaxID=185453 RepID=A0A9B0WYI2_CHRAS|nr:PREDICTED: MORC family CW-type zinc finger protein 1 [Chrysochloris asiatica]
MSDKYASLQRAQLHLDFIHANSTVEHLPASVLDLLNGLKNWCNLLFSFDFFISTTHSFLFGALAELLDNARSLHSFSAESKLHPGSRMKLLDKRSQQKNLDSLPLVVGNEKLQGGFMLCFLDDGCGMSPEEASDIIYFGTSKKRLSNFKFIGQYGNGLKSGSMRIGKDFILFTKKEETMTCVFLSQTFCEQEGLSEVVVPIPSWLTRSREYVTNDPIKFSTELAIIYKYSPFKTEAELMQQFDMIYGKCGTLLVIYNLKLLLNGEPELDVKTDQEDILVAGATEEFPERWSLRAYTSILYFDPQMRIFIQAKRVQTKHLNHCLYRPRKYLYVTSSFKGTFKNQVKKAEEAVKIAEHILKETQIKVNKLNRTSLSSPAKNALQKALEDVEAKHKALKEKQREFKKEKTLPLFFGVSIENRSQAGMFIYSNCRLIKMHEKVGPQLKLKSLVGTGVIGIVNIPLEIMEPSHNKQEFLNVQKYKHLLKVMGQYLVQYCKDTRISNRNLSLFWNEFRCQNSKDVEKSLDLVRYQRRQAMTIPFLIQCDLCLKWRVLPSNANYQEKEFLDIWICANNPNPLENSCHQKEQLPSIPLGTISTVSPSKNEKEKQLRELVQRYHDKFTDQQSQENTKTKRMKPLSSDLMHESLPSVEVSVNCRGWKRSTEGSDSDVEFISETKVMKKTGWKKMKPQQWRHPAVSPENVKPTQRVQNKSQIGNISTMCGKYKPNEGPSEKCLASSWEMKRKQSQNLMQECKALIEDETKNEDLDKIRVLDKRDTAVLLKQEEKEVPLINEDENPELCSIAPKIKRNSLLPNLKRLLNATLEDLNASSGHKARFSEIGGGKVDSSLKKSFQSIFAKEKVQKLMFNLREFLLYFFPEYQLPSELDYTYVEEPLPNSEVEQCPEQTNTKLKMCFNQIQNVYMVQYEKGLRRKMQAIISSATRREEVSEICLGQCEEERKLTEDKLNNLRVKLAVLLQKLQLGDPAGDPEQIDSYLEALLKEDNLPFQNALKKVTIESGCNFSSEKK